MKPATLRVAAVAALVLAAAAYEFLVKPDGGGPTAAVDDAPRIVEAFDAQRSDLWVESSGVVDRTLPDDKEGSAHQRFIVRLSNDHTVLIAHNIDLAPRVPLRVGDLVTFRGEYEWNPKGGVIHWTHHDPRNRHSGGWIRHQGDEYR